jgi:hypothetical protein
VATKYNLNFKIYHETVGSAIEEAWRFVEASGSEAVNPDWRTDTHWNHLFVEDSARYDIPLKSYKGKPTGKYLHINIYRLFGGRYELNLYVL